jgi:hypothetical protein
MDALLLSLVVTSLAINVYQYLAAELRDVKLSHACDHHAKRAEDLQEENGLQATYMEALGQENARLYANVDRLERVKSELILANLELWAADDLSAYIDARPFATQRKH